MNDQERLMDVFDQKWQGKRGKYTVKWCDLCDTAFISCLSEDCFGSTCNAGGCDKCKEDFDEFNSYKTCVTDYLTKEEIEIWEKGLTIKKFILERILHNEKELDWQKLDDEGKLSHYDRMMFLPDVKGI